ncbi:hypothetical protein [Hyphobacterium marinum]|uniref:Uncharacterized protein n=1 Tax=Hyphobacterium marinum TaxID=3116574 RepID=A0ABU7LVI6_9PROT|nr:hypothetical protein [Hyphobacterium sp. Y6023]MEE2565501.1 hypothetical protein [Hyphobacterium sp. Y6023]
MDAAIGLIGVVIGACIGLIGAWLGPKWQAAENAKSLKITIVTFIDDQISSYISIIDTLTKIRGKTGIIQLITLNQVFPEYNSFERNREHLLRLDNEEIRYKIKQVFAELNSTAQVLYNLVQQESNIPAEGRDDDYHKNLIQNIDYAWGRFLEFEGRLVSLRKELKALTD